MKASAATSSSAPTPIQVEQLGRQRRTLAQPTVLTPVGHDAVVEETPTRALRAKSEDLLASGLAALLKSGEQQWRTDPRDLMVVLAPYHDCARRLGLDPGKFFENAAVTAPPSLRETVASFGHRDDITPEAFRFAVVDETEGPRYEWL